MTDRAAYTAGLRALADILDSNPEMPLPYHGTQSPIAIYHLAGAQGTREAFLASVRAFPGRKDKGVLADVYRITALDGLVEIAAYRDTVCERVVTGTREVTREVPAREAQPATEATTVTETVEDVRWECSPLTGPANA